MRLKAAVWKKKGVLEIDEVPESEVKPEDVKIKVEYTAICGSDPHIVDGTLPVSNPPRVMGHEMSGTVVELGPKAKLRGLKVGDRVTGNRSVTAGSATTAETARSTTAWLCRSSSRPGPWPSTWSGTSSRSSSSPMG